MQISYLTEWGDLNWLLKGITLLISEPIELVSRTAPLRGGVQSWDL